MAEVVRINQDVTIPLDELEFRTSRASGPGGQGVNTTDSRVELRFDLAASPSLPEAARDRARRRLAGRLDAHGVLRVVAQAQRSQLLNRRAAIERFAGLLEAAIAPPRPPRRATRPSAAARERRLAAKRHRGDVKLTRRPPRIEEG